MGFGEEPERGPHDECAFEIHILKSKLAERDAEIGRLTKTLSNQGAIMDKRQSERGEIVARLKHFGITGEDLVGCVADLGVQRDRARAINDAIAKMPDVFERAGVGDGSVVDAVAAVIGALVCAERGNSDLTARLVAAEKIIIAAGQELGFYAQLRARPDPENGELVRLPKNLVRVIEEIRLFLANQDDKKAEDLHSPVADERSADVTAATPASEDPEYRSDHVVGNPVATAGAGAPLTDNRNSVDIRCASCAEPVSSLVSPELLEALADVEHKRWAGWMDYLVSKSMPVVGGVLIPVDLAQHWAHLCNTAYADLEEHSKESDRKEVRKTLAVIHKYLSCPRGHDDGLMDVGHRPVDRPLSDEMHPTGWCSCAGEGTCEWCKWRASTDKPSAEADEIIERLRRKCGGECGVEDCLWHLAADALDATNKALLRWQTDTMIEGDFVCADGSIATGTFSKE